MTHSKLIPKSEEQIIWLDRQINGLSMNANFRNRLAGGCFDTTTEFQKAIVLLVKNQLNGPAFALVRLLFESCIRGIWLHQCADESELQKFAKGKIPDFYLLLEGIEKLEPYKDGVLSKLKERSWKNMNSFTHTGFHQVVRRQTETTIEANYDDDEIVEVINFTNLIGYVAAIEICNLANNQELAEIILNRLMSETAQKE